MQPPSWTVRKTRCYPEKALEEALEMVGQLGKAVPEGQDEHIYWETAFSMVDLQKICDVVNAKYTDPQADFKAECRLLWRHLRDHAAPAASLCPSAVP